VFDWDPNGIALFDPDGILRMASRQIEEIFGLPLRAMYGLGFEEIYRRKLAQAAPADREPMLARVRAIFANRDATSRDDVELERPRHRWLTRNSVPVRSVDGEYLGRLVVYMDVTEQRELDRQRADFFTVAAHELRTPLTPLSMYLQSIDRRVARGQAVDGELMTKARRQVDRLGKLVEDLLDVSRLESGQYTVETGPLEVGPFCEGVVELVRGRATEKQIVLGYDGPATLRVLADRRALEQVLVNLLDNAVKFTPQGGRVTLLADGGGPFAVLSVIDSGPGIEPRHRERIFERFYRVDMGRSRESGGTGLGLSIVKHLVQAQGGQVGVESGRGGSRFWVRLPVAT